MTMKLKEILKGVDIIYDSPFRDTDIAGITNNSKQAKDKFLFVAIAGTKFDGRDFIEEAINRGARTIIYASGHLDEHILRKKGITFIRARDIYRSVAVIADNFYHHPSSRVKVVGITGTNGKTTTTYLIENILKKAGFKSGVIGTINYRFGQRLIPATNTTPGPIQLQELLHNMEMEGVNYAVMEVSSHGLEQRRVEGIDFRVGVFTNVTMDHLDYHKTFENYFHAKSMLFKGLSSSSWAIINIDDSYGKQLLLHTEAKTITYAIDNTADVEARDISGEIDGSRFTVVAPYGRFETNTPLIGRHNIYNILAAVSYGVSQNIALDLIRQGIEELSFVPGRLERIDVGQPFKVFVDYAHTDDALKNVLLSLRPLCRGKIIVVFGCGGDRYRDKRPLMGKIASDLADYVVLTTDNPRSEEPEAIIKDIEEGFPKEFANYRVILDRYAAIKEAICLAEDDDVVIIAGKGHETYQIFKNTTMPFDDRIVAKEVLLENDLLRCG